MKQTIRPLSRILAITALSFACGCETMDSARTDSTQPTAAPAFVHSFSKFVFPQFVGAFRRSEVQKYDQEGRDVGVGYGSLTPIAATVYVYPGAKDFTLLPTPKLANVSTTLLEQHFQVCKQELLRKHADAKAVTETRYTIVQGPHQFAGKKAVFTMNFKFGFSAQESVSGLHVFFLSQV